MICPNPYNFYKNSAWVYQACALVTDIDGRTPIVWQLNELYPPTAHDPWTAIGSIDENGVYCDSEKTMLPLCLTINPNELLWLYPHQRVAIQNRKTGKHIIKQIKIDLYGDPRTNPDRPAGVGTQQQSGTDTAGTLHKKLSMYELHGKR